MKLLSKEALPAILPLKRGRDTKLRLMLLRTQVGEGVFMPKEEWVGKSSPYYIVARVKKTHGFVFEYGMEYDGSGWKFRRVK